MGRRVVAAAVEKASELRAEAQAIPGGSLRAAAQRARTLKQADDLAAEGEEKADALLRQASRRAAALREAAAAKAAETTKQSLAEAKQLLQQAERTAAVK